MKQSNLILGIGILVAVILIAGLLFLKTEPLVNQSADKQIKPVTSLTQSAKNMISKPFRVFAQHFIKVR